MEQALDYLTAVLFPQMEASVDTVGDLPAVGNTINDMRVVNDDGDGKSASYRWEQREGEATPSWHKIYDVDFGTDSILQAWQIKTQDTYVSRYGYDDRDADGDVIAGDLAGQKIYGGASANTHLTLFANSGDGVGAATGWVQFGDSVRPTADNTLTMGTAARRFSHIFGVLATVGTLALAGGSITDTSGTIAFGDENLTTTGHITAGTLRIAGGVITDTTGSISFADENLSTTGTLAVGAITATSITATGAVSALRSGSTIGNLTLADGSITDSSGSISFGNENLATTGTLAAGASTLTSALVGNVSIATGTITTNANALELNSFTGIVNVTAATLNAVAIDASSSVDGGNLRISGNTLSSVDANGSVNLDPNGAGKIVAHAVFNPHADATHTLGEAALRWTNLFLSGSIGDGADSISIANLLTFRDVGAPNAGDALFWDGSKWVASNPDTEISHDEIDGLGDDDHTQYALLAGRAGGQTLTGGTAAGDDLTLESTSHGTKGNVFFASVLAPSSDGTLDFGDASHRVKDAYIAGELIGARLQNATTAGRPAANAGTTGRMIYDTDLQDVFVDHGGTWKKLSLEKYVLQDTTGWDGAATSVAYDVSAEVSDARECIWVLKSNTDSFRQMGVEITMTQTHVTVTVSVPLPAGTYTLVGVG